MSGVPIYLARHGQTPYNVEKRFQGQNDVDLDETGVRQAHELAEPRFGVLKAPTPAGAISMEVCGSSCFSSHRDQIITA